MFGSFPQFETDWFQGVFAALVEIPKHLSVVTSNLLNLQVKFVGH